MSRCKEGRNIPTCVGKHRRAPFGRRPAWNIPTCVGKTFTVNIDKSVGGNIPTCVGKTAPGRGANGTWTEHPHVRGKTPITPSEPREATEHPHVRGENFGLLLLWHYGGGTSPRAWENQYLSSRSIRTHGTSPRAWENLRRNIPLRPIWNIPTCVGKTISAVIDKKNSEHPHVRGKQLKALFNFLVRRNIPRAWGKLFLS